MLPVPVFIKVPKVRMWNSARRVSHHPQGDAQKSVYSRTEILFTENIKSVCFTWQLYRTCQSKYCYHLISLLFCHTINKLLCFRWNSKCSVISTIRNAFFLSLTWNDAESKMSSKWFVGSRLPPPHPPPAAQLFGTACICRTQSIDFFFSPCSKSLHVFLFP